ncbi:MAG: nucleoside triphosphate pyrophosphohydrolase [Pseudomonadota bacterium]|jgi:nucleoside triphosphate diphosphatase
MTLAQATADLLELMARLRDPETGCPWDLQQDFRSIAPHTLEEACEVVDAIERDDYGHLPEELGDLLFQVVFYAQLGRERGLFDFETIVSGLVRKLVSRHPHVFPDGTLAGRRAPGAAPAPAAVKGNWERIKQGEREARGDTDPLAGIAPTLSALARSAKLQKRAARAGFDWPGWESVPAKIREELAEVEAAVAAGDQVQIREEAGDLLFACVNLLRHLGVDGDAALRAANRKFERRFRLMLDYLGGDAEALRALSMDAREALWRRAKKKDTGAEPPAASAD